MNGPRREHLCAGSRNLCPDIFSSEMDAAPPQALTSYQLRSQREGGFTLIVSRYSALLQSSPSRRQTRLLYIRFRVALLDIRIAVGATGLLSTTQTASFYKCEHLHRKGFIHSEEDDPIQKREQLAQSELQNLVRVSPCAALNGRPFQFQSRVRKCWCLRTWVRPRSSHGDPHFAFDMCAPLMTLPAGHATRKEV